MNIVKLQNDLKDLSDRQLMDTMQAGSAPQYLVLGEMQRRKKMRSEAQSKPQQQTSVAEDTVQGLAGMAPMVQMNSGGIVGFAGGKRVTGYQKGAAEACYTDPSTGKTTCPPAKADTRTAKIKKFASGREVYKDIESIESSGRQYDAEGNVLTSPKGAKGVMQVMPTTAMDPGYGARNIFQLADDLGVDYGGKKDLKTAELLLSNEMLNRAMGEEYFNAMANRFGSEEAAMAAYNAGPGRVGRSGFDESGDRNVLPEETQDYLAKADKLRAERELPTQTAAEGIAALGEGKMQLTDSEKAPSYTGEELAGKIVRGESIDYTNVPGDSPLRGVKGGYDEGVFYDEGGAYDVRDLVGFQAGSPTIYENTTDPLNYNLPIRPTGDDGLMALAAKAPYGRPVGLLPGEKIVNAAERATAEDYEEVPYRAFTPDGEPFDIEAMGNALRQQSAAEAIAALGEGRGSYGPGEMSPATPSKRATAESKAPEEVGSYWGGLGKDVKGDAPAVGGVESVYNYLFDPTERKAAAMSRLERQQMEGDMTPEELKGAVMSAQERMQMEGEAPSMPEPDELEGYDNPLTPEKGVASLPAAQKETKKDAEEERKSRIQELDDQIYGENRVNEFVTMPEGRQPQDGEYSPVKGDDFNEFLMRMGLGMAASKRGTFMEALGEGGLGALKGMQESRKAAAEEAGRMERARMQDAATRYSADVGLRARQLESVRKAIDDIRNEIIEREYNMPPEWKQGKLDEIKALMRTQQKLLGTSATVDSSLATRR